MGWYWIRKLQARVFAGDYSSAMAAASKATPLLWTLPTDFELAEYHFYGALARAAACDSATSGQRRQHLEALSAHHEKLTAWAENCPENFANRAALVGRRDCASNGRELDAEQPVRGLPFAPLRLYGFIQNEGIANERAARFYMARGLKKIADVYLRDARDCYVRWGADGKVRQLDRSIHTSGGPATPCPTSTIATSVEQLDLATVIKVSQAVSARSC